MVENGVFRGGVEFFDLGSWFLVLGSWFLVLGSWFLVPGSWFLVPGSLARCDSRVQLGRLATYLRTKNEEPGTKNYPLCLDPKKARRAVDSRLRRKYSVPQIA